MLCHDPPPNNSFIVVVQALHLGACSKRLFKQRATIFLYLHIDLLVSTPFGRPCRFKRRQL